MKAALRILLAMLVVAGSLLVLEPAKVLASPTAPTFLCPPGTTPEVCAAVQVVETTARVLELISPGAIPAPLNALLEDLAEGPFPSIDSTMEDVRDFLGCSEAGLLAACVEWVNREAAIAQRIKEAVKAAAQLAEFCADTGSPWYFGCPEEELEGSEWTGNDGTALGPPDYAGTTWGTQTWLPENSMALVVVDPAAFEGCPSGPTALGPEPCWIAGTDEPWYYNGAGAALNRGGGVFGYLSGGLLRIGYFVYTGGSPWQYGTIGTTLTPTQVGDYVPLLLWFRDRALTSQTLVMAHASTPCETATDLSTHCQIGSAMPWHSTNKIVRHIDVAPYNDLLIDEEPLGDRSIGVVHVRRWNGVANATNSAEALAAAALLTSMPLTVDFPSPSTVRPGTEELTPPTTEVAPTTTVVPAPPTAPTIPADPTGTHEEQQTGLLQQIKNGITNGFTWLGDKLGGLLTWLGGRIAWLGDIFGYWIRWLWDRLNQILTAVKAAINAVGDIIIWVMTVVRDAILALGQTMWSVLEALWALPQALATLLLDGLELLLEFLFVPSTSFDLADCTGTFPCNWVEEINGVIGGVQGDLSDLGGCVAPTIGWSEFEASFPPPPGCTGGNEGAAGEHDDTAGDLFGWRAVLRGFFVLSLWFAFVRKLLALAPWSKEGDMPLSAGEVTV